MVKLTTFKISTKIGMQMRQVIPKQTCLFKYDNSNNSEFYSTCFFSKTKKILILAFKNSGNDAPWIARKVGIILSQSEKLFLW